MNSAVNSELKQGLIINFITKYSNLFLQFGLSAILSRLLTPEEYGIVAVVTVFTTFFSLLSEMGIGPAIIQKKYITEEEKSSLFNITIIIAMILSVIFYLFSYKIADFYGNREYINIGKLLSVIVFLNTLSIVPQNLLRKEKKFKTLGWIQIISLIISGVIAIILAYKEYSYYSIIFQSIIFSLLSFIFSFNNIRIKISSKISFDILKEIWKFSSYQFLFNFINYFSRNLDNILIGKVMGPASLGYYDKAYKLMLYPIGILTSTISSTIHPILARYQDDLELIYETYMKVVKILSIIGIPLSIYLYFTASEIVTILYGTGWEKTIPIFKVLAISVSIQMILSSSGSIFQSVGKTNYLFISGFLSAIVMVTGIILGLMQKKLLLLAWFLVLAFIVNFIQCYYIMVKKIFNKKLKSFLRNLKSGFIIGVITIVLHLLLSKYTITINELFESFIIKTIISGVGFILGIYVTGEIKELRKFKL